MGDLEIALLGPMRVELDGRALDIGSGRLRAVLAVLAMSARQPVSTERLADAVWGEQPPGNLRKSVQTNIVRLRRLVGSDRIRTAYAGYLLDVEPDRVDALRLCRLLATAARQGDPAAQRRLLTEAVSLWRGAPFEGVVSPWLAEVEAARMTELILGAHERLVDLDLGSGRHEAAVACLRELTGRFPFREALWSRLLLALRMSGRQAEALACYESVRVKIADELGVDPGPELRRQYAELLSGTAAPAAAPADPGPARAWPDRMPTAVPRQLPAPARVFVGRARELDELDRLLGASGGGPDSGSPRSAIVVLHGLGGIGKTALAVDWAHRARDRFPDGQLFVDLHGYGPGDPVEAGVALRSLLIGAGVPESRIPLDLETRSSTLRTVLSGRSFLLVLDNAHDASHVRPLIPGPGSVALVTSRNQLHGLAVREGAHRIGLDPLSPAESTALLRAKLADQPQVVDVDNLDEVAELCGHLPLALSIAAERSASTPGGGIRALLDELRDGRRCLAALAVGDETGDMHAVLTGSYQALDPRAARAFRLLGRHPGSPIDIAAAAALLETTVYDASAVLDCLADRHLLRRVAGRRFEFHALVRAYAADLVRADDVRRERRTVQIPAVRDAMAPAAIASHGA